MWPVEIHRFSFDQIDDAFEVPLKTHWNLYKGSIVTKFGSSLSKNDIAQQ